MSIVKSRLPLLLNRRDNATLFQDSFTGSTADTAWTVTDTESKLSVSGGKLVCSGGKAAPAWGDPQMQTRQTFTRYPGLTYEFDLLGTGATMQAIYGFYDTTPTNSEAYIQETSNLNLRALVGSSITAINNLTIVSSTQYRLKVILAATGAWFYVQGGIYAAIGSGAWTLWAYAALGSGNCLYLNNLRDATFTSTDVKIYQGKIPVPVVNVASVAAITPTLGSELLTDGGLENWASATDLTSWTESLSGTSTVDREATIVHGGTYSAKETVDASNNTANLSQAGTLAAGSWVLLNWWGYASALSKTLRVTMGDTAVLGAVRDPGTVWTNYFDVLRTTLANQNMTLRRGSAASASVYFDDVSAKPITLSSCLGSNGGDFGVSDYVASINPTLTVGTQYGMMLNVDNGANPANFILAYHDGTNAQLLKCVTGTYTSLISTAATYSAGAVLSVVKVGQIVTLLYNNAIIGTAQTISDAGVISNTRHYPFSTLAGNSATNFRIDV